MPPNEAVSNGMSFASGSMLGGPRFPPVSSTRPPPMGSPPIVSAPAPPQAPPVSSMQSRPPFSAGGPGVPPPFLAGSQGVPPPPGPPFGAQTWSLQPQQVSNFFDICCLLILQLTYILSILLYHGPCFTLFYLIYVVARIEISSRD